MKVKQKGKVLQQMMVFEWRTLWECAYIMACVKDVVYELTYSMAGEGIQKISKLQKNTARTR